MGARTNKTIYVMDWTNRNICCNFKVYCLIHYTVSSDLYWLGVTPY